MRFFVLVFCGLVLSFGCFAQEDFSITEPSIGQFNNDFSTFLSSIKRKGKSDFKTVHRLFNKAHRVYLRNYVAYAQVDDIFKKSNYDCLSGTYFFSKAFDALKISYKIVETNYHIFLTVQTERGEVLIETTDRFNGFVSDQKAIDERIESYQQTKSSSGAELYLSGVRIFHELHACQLPGLLYFNRAVEAFNKNDLSSSCLFLEQAWKIYDNQRIEVFSPILVHSIEISTLEKAEKRKLISVIETHQHSTLRTIASR